METVSELDPDAVATLSDESYRLLFENASDAILTVVVATRRILTFNRRLLELTGFTETQLRGADIGTLAPRPPAGDDEGQGDGNDPDRFSTTLSPEVLALPGLHEEVRVRRADDYVFFASTAVRHVEVGGRSIAICVLRDTTERRMLERELVTKHVALRQTHLELVVAKRRLEEQQRDVTNLAERITNLSKRAALGEITAGLAHGINNPLAALASASRQIAKTVAGVELSDKVRERLAVLLQRQGAAVDRISEVVTAVRRVHAGQPAAPMKATNIVAEIESTLGLFEHRLAEVRVAKRFRDVPSVNACADELRHLFANLIDNALLATDGRGGLEIAVDMDGQEVLVSISDDGPGLPELVRQRLFEPFVTTRENGTGLGLATSLRVAHRHGGRLRAESVQPHGTRFVFSMPVHVSEEVRHAT